MEVESDEFLLIKEIQRMNETRKKVVCYGEVLWDVYPDYKKLGGAPFNVAGHLRKLGFEVNMISRVGQDTMGEEILKAIDEQDIPRDLIQIDPVNPTGYVKVLLDALGKPTYEIVQPVAWDFITTTTASQQRVREADLFLFGTLACRHEVSRSTLLQLLDLSAFAVFDMNLRQNFFSQEIIAQLLEKTKVLKLNDEEFDVLRDMFQVTRDNLYDYLLKRYGMDLIIQTKGAEGAEVYDGTMLQNNAGYRIDVVDTVGSGDAFLAGFLNKYLLGGGIHDCLDFACRLGAFVATQPGAIPSYTQADLHGMIAN